LPIALENSAFGEIAIQSSRFIEVQSISLNLHALAVQEETALGIEFEPAEA
jgi:hypothetical protein